MDSELLREIQECLPGGGSPRGDVHAEIARANGAALCLDEIDSGLSLQQTLNLYTNRIRQLKLEIAAYKREADHVVDQNLMTNLELIALNQDLELKVRQRTQELEQANERLRELDAVKESMTHMIVHDMKNPLTAILGTLRLFEKKRFGVKPEIQELLLGALGHGHRLLDMVEGILIISRMQTKEFRLKLEPIDLVKLIRQCLDLMRQTLGAKNLVLKFNPPVPQLAWTLDVQIIERVVNNLLNNAIKYAPDGTDVVVDLAVLNQGVAVGVTNLGEPIPHQHHQKIFELFARVNEKDTQLSGSGIGLNFCKLAVEAHGGSIRLISPVPPSPGGVQFVFSLPAGV